PGGPPPARTASAAGAVIAPQHGRLPPACCPVMLVPSPQGGGMGDMGNKGPGWTPARRLDGKVAVVMGAGQSPGEGFGNGRATALRFAREGARVLAVDRHLESAEETAELIRKEGFE